MIEKTIDLINKDIELFSKRDKKTAKLKKHMKENFLWMVMKRFQMNQKDRKKSID